MSELVQVLPVAKIRPPKFRIRDPGLLDELKASIKEKGLLQPIIVRPSNSHFEVVAGHRRYVAMIELGKKDIPASVIQATDKEAFEIALMENIQRKTMTFREEGEAYRRYCKDFGWGGQTELANKLGISNRTVSERIAFAESGEQIIHGVESGQLTLTHAEELNRLPSLNTEILSEAMDDVNKHHLDTDQTRSYVDGIKAGYDREQAVQHALFWPDVPYKLNNKKPDLGAQSREHIYLALEDALKKIMVNIETMPDEKEKREWNESVRYPVHQLTNVVIRLTRKYGRQDS